MASQIIIGKRVISKAFGPYIIAEAGVNHNGSLDTAFKLVDEAVHAGAHSVKFQTFKTENLTTEQAHKAGYQIKTTGGEESQFEMLKKLELSYDEFIKLKKYCDESDIEFMSTPFDKESAEFLVNDVGVKVLKVPSSEVTNTVALKHLCHFGLPIILSTGSCSLGDVERAVDVLKGNLLPKFVLLHCVMQYPSDIRNTNLRAMLTLERAFGCLVGYSDHTVGINVPIAAAALGATVIEKHFTLDKSMKGPDHAASLCPDELKAMVEGVSEVVSALGSGIKRPTQREQENATAMRKSLVANADLPAGTCLQPHMLDIKRPGTGIPPYMLDWVDQLVLRRPIKKGEVLTEDHFKIR